MGRRSIGSTVGEIADSGYNPETRNESADEKDQEEDLLKIIVEIVSANCTSEKSKGMDWLMFVFNSSYIGNIWSQQIQEKFLWRGKNK